MAEQDRPFDVFLSYNRKDLPAVRRLAQRLRGQGLKVWLDLDELIPGRPWQEALERNIKSIGTAAILVGKAGIGSWQDQEVSLYLRKFVKDRKPVIPVLLEECPEEPDLPIFLEHYNWVDCRAGQQEEGFWRLVWGITGQKPEALSRPAQASVDQAAAGGFGVAPLQSGAGQAAGGGAASVIVPRGTSVDAAEASETDSPPRSFRDPLKGGGFGPEMVVVPRGTFRMGDLDGKGYEDERPVHQVRIAQPFAIGRYAVTFEEYDCFVQATQGRSPADFGWGRGRRPVVDVSWEDACAYARWLSEQTGKPYRLPSEAEWEYAARAGTETAYWWGDEIGESRANFGDSGSQWSNKKTAPVGSFPANPWGLHDTAGNVWEWVQDRWHGSYEGAPEDGSAWESGGSASKVLRGGCWDDLPRRARSACRFNCVPANRNGYLGFRLVCSSPSLNSDL